MIWRLLAIAALAVSAVSCTHRPSSGDTPNGGGLPSSAGTPSSASTPDSAGTPNSEGTPSSGATPTQEQTVPVSPGEPTPEPNVTESTGAPAPEPTDPESTQTKQQKPSIKIANAPIGGDNPSVDGVDHCAIVNWLGKKPIPDGTTITVKEIHLESEGVFTLRQSACGDRRPCSGIKWQSADPVPCYVGARQIVSSSDEVRLVIKASAVCATKADCQSLTAGFGESQIFFFPEELETTPSETASNETSPKVTPSAETTPDETPSGG
ncbi:hypothetical protein OG558_26300 [Kribbella sp. NBC_01510]|uniref:hypothetical protein n=1 Tax=Kribbella sp. NBC_01510 TaxID=2903581 RepID=UPI0038667921